MLLNLALFCSLLASTILSLPVPGDGFDVTATVPVVKYDFVRAHFDQIGELFGAALK